MKYQAIRPHFFSMVGWGVAGWVVVWGVGVGAWCAGEGCGWWSGGGCMVCW